MSDELALLDATAQAALVRDGKLSPSELVDAAIARLEALNPTLGAVIHPALERARARAASPELPDGPFRGVPFLMKDLGGNEADQPYCAGMRFLKEAGWKEPRDSHLTERFVRAGLVSLGRTNTPELGLLPVSEPEAFGPTRNPWRLEHSAGGSSGGSAAAVAAGIVSAAHASDGGGSIRGPASMCGLVGLKPTRGRISFGPGLGERWGGFSCEFVVTRSVRDSAALLDATQGAAPGDPYSARPPARPYLEEVGAATGRLRIGMLRDAPRDLELHPEPREAVDATARALERAGHHVEEAHPDALEDPGGVATYVMVVSSCTARALDAWGQAVGRPVEQRDVEPLTWALAERGRQTSAAEYLAGVEFMHGFGRRLAAWWESGFDLLLTPTQAAPPPEIGFISSTADEPFRGFVRAAPYGVFTLPFNMSGQPAISLPARWTSSEPAGLPLGAQLVAATGREDLLFRVAAQLEQCAPWADRRPGVFA